MHDNMRSNSCHFVVKERRLLRGRKIKIRVYRSVLARLSDGQAHSKSRDGIMAAAATVHFLAKKIEHRRLPNRTAFDVRRV